MNLKSFGLSVTPEIVEQSWRGWHLRYQQLYPENDWKILIHDLRNMVNKEIYVTDEKLQSITSKVLLAWGDNDIFKWDHIIHLYKTIPETQLLILPGTSHSTFDEQPELMSLAIKSFFSK